MALFASDRLLWRDHVTVQHEHVDRARAVWQQLHGFGDDGGVQRDLEYVHPSEGWASYGSGRIYRDPFGTQRMGHDVVSREALMCADPVGNAAFRDGAHRDMTLVAAGIRDALASNGIPDASAIRANAFTVHGDMRVNVVNIVHTSYCAIEGVRHHANTTVVTHRAMWRQLLHLGCQQNMMHTTVKVCYAHPFRTSHLLFQSGRVLETGASNMVVARTMIQSGTLAYIQRAMRVRIGIVSRHAQNMVATSCMPRGMGLSLSLMSRRFNYVQYTPRSFAGAVITHPTLPKVIVLAFPKGPIVCVGPRSIEEMQEAIRGVYHILMDNTDTAENRQRELLFSNHADNDDLNI